MKSVFDSTKQGLDEALVFSKREKETAAELAWQADLIAEGIKVADEKRFVSDLAIEHIFKKYEDNSE